MKNIHILLVEDELLYAADISSKLSRQGYKIIKHVDSGKECLTFLERNHDSIDLVLMDIDLGSVMDGIQTAECIQNKQYNIPIIYLTNYTEKYIFQRAVKTMPANYLNKSFTLEALSNAIDLAFFNASQSTKTYEKKTSLPKEHLFRDTFFIRKGIGHTKLKIEEVIWIEAHKAYCIIQTLNKPYMLAINTTEFERRFRHPYLVRAHKSFIINLQNVKSIEGDFLIMNHAKAIQSDKVSNGRIPIGRKHKEKLLSFFHIV